MNSLMPLELFFKKKKKEAHFTQFKDFAFALCSSIEKI